MAFIKACAGILSSNRPSRKLPIWPFASDLSFYWLELETDVNHVCRGRDMKGPPTCPSLSWTAHLKDGEMLTELQADPKERYPISELLADLESCNAHRVLLFLDQSYPGPLAKKLRVSKHHPNVVLVRGTTTNGGSSFAEFWAGLQPDQCLLQHILPVGSWSAVLASGTPAQLLNVTLAGAPCHSMPPLGEEERQRRYQGCQNLPTMLWYQSRHRQLPQEED